MSDKEATRLDFHPDNCKMLEANRNVYLCWECGQIQAHDYIAGGLGQGIWFNPCLCRAVTGSNWKSEILDRYTRH